MNRTEGQLTLSLSVRGREVFHDVKNVSVLGPPIPSTTLAQWTAADLAVCDPSGMVPRFLRDHGVAFTPLANLDHLPERAQVLVVGSHALTEPLSTSTSLAAFALSGKRVIVLEQDHPLHYQAIQPAEVEAARNQGCTAFLKDATHPAVRGLEHKDFFTWNPDEAVYRNAYVKPTRNARSIIQCHEQLAYSGLIEVPVGSGLMLLCQLRVGETLPANAVAQRLLLNLLDHAATYRLVFQPAVAAVDGAPELARALERIGLVHERRSDPLLALGTPGARIAVLAATPATLRTLASHPDQVDAFCKTGGTILLNGLTPDGLKDYNALVGFNHMIRPFRRERVTFPPVKHPLMAGLTLADVVLYSSERIFTWQEGRYVSADSFSYVVDLEDVAPFAQYENDFVRMMSNGMTSADGWKYIVNVPAPDRPPLDFRLVLPEPQEIREVEWIGNTFYDPVTRFELIFDGIARTSFSVKPTNDPQTLTLNPPQRGKTITVRLAEWQQIPGKNQVTGLDNIRLLATRPADFASKVRPMLNIGGLVHYPRGAGGIILCNLKFQEHDDAPENPEKKRAILAGLLHNLKARFAGGKTIIPGAWLDYSSVDLSRHANQFRDDRGWFGDRSRTFADLPTGRQTLAGVPFEIYEFRTSPVPSVIMLAGPGVPGGLSDSIRGIPVDRRADALFFLQAARIDVRRTDQEAREQKAFELACYVITYTDGQTVTVPIRSEIDVDDYRQKTPVSLPGAQLAWTRKYPDRDEFATAYVQQWTNPRPDAAIRAVGLAYGNTPRRGVPALIAITAATAKKAQ